MRGGASVDGLGPVGVLARLQKRGPDAPSLHRVPSGSKGPPASQEPLGKRYVRVWAGGGPMLAQALGSPSSSSLGCLPRPAGLLRPFRG